MYLCYLDESGSTGASPPETTHFVLAGLSIPIWNWRAADREIANCLAPYGLAHAEIHTAWMLRRYPEESDIPGFRDLDYGARRELATIERSTSLSRLARRRKHREHKLRKRLYKETSAYLHLTLEERRRALHDVARTVSRWGFARLFAECVDKTHFDPARTFRTIEEQAFEQVVSRFEHYLRSRDRADTSEQPYGLLVHDHNQTVASRHTRLMRSFQARGTLWTDVDHIVETPFFVDSQLTRMVQIADLCAYALRRYVENRERRLFDMLFRRADRQRDTVVGVRHFTRLNCRCTICNYHRT